MKYGLNRHNLMIYVNSAAGETARSAAAQLAERTGAELTEDEQTAQEHRKFGLLLIYDADGLTLAGGDLTMRGDMTAMLPRLRQSNLEREMLIKAARVKGLAHPRLLDATAGMGEDSLLLAAAGFEVTMYEYDAVIAALLRDAMRRAADVAEMEPVIGRMHLVEDDSIAAMREMGELGIREKEKQQAEVQKESKYDVYEEQSSTLPDVILLDPMFPARSKSALIKKKFQLLQQLELPCANEKDLLDAALSVGARKVVIKRPLKGPYLAGVRPQYSLAGKAIRYDIL